MAESPTRVPDWTGGPFRIVSAGLTHVGLSRSLNEDSLYLDDAAGLWAVADGMGGHAGGDHASAAVVEGLREVGAHAEAHAKLVRFSDRIHAANARLREEARARGVSAMGSTLVALMQAERNCLFAWVGDSRGYLLRDGRIEQVTRDHSVVQELVASGRLRPDEAETHPHAHVLTRAVGAADRVDIDFRQMTLRPGDRCLLCSDGLSRCVAEEAILEAASMNAPTDACRALIDATLAAGAPDNVTVVIVAFD